jgi:hypothetical protein
MTDADVLVYAHASAVLLRLPLDAARARRVAAHLQRTAALAALLEQTALTPDDEPAEIYCPKRPTARPGPP